MKPGSLQYLVNVIIPGSQRQPPLENKDKPKQILQSSNLGAVGQREDRLEVPESPNPRYLKFKNKVDNIGERVIIGVAICTTTGFAFGLHPLLGFALSAHWMYRLLFDRESLLPKE